MSAYQQEPRTVGGSAGNQGKERRKGVPNKVTSQLKDAILVAIEEAGAEGGLVGYLRRIADETPTAFVPLLGQMLPLQVKTNVTSPIAVMLSGSDARPF